MFFKRLKECERRLDSIGPLVADTNTGVLIQISKAVGVKCIQIVSGFWGDTTTTTVQFFTKGTEPKCDYIEIKDGEVTYHKTVNVEVNNVEVNRDGMPLKAKKVKKIIKKVTKKKK